MPKRRHGLIDDSSEESDSNEDVKNEDLEPSHNPTWPVVLKTGNKRSRKPQSDDDEYTDSDLSEQSANSELSDAEFEFSDGGFVVDSDDNVDKKGYSNRRNGRGRRSRGRPRKTENLADKRKKRAEARNNRRSHRAASDEDDDDESEAFSLSDGSIAEELRELKGTESPAKAARHYRIRAPVNYMIPPPPTIEEVALAKAKEAEMNANAKLRDPRARRLFDVSGPFGGKDVHTIFKVDKAELKEIISSHSGTRFPTNTDPSVPAGLGNLPTGGADNADVDPVDVSGVDFSMVGGLDHYIAKLKEMVSLPLLYPELYEKFGITPPRGVLFHGPPGTGKTLMARALAASHKQEKVTFYMRKGADILSKWVGESERQLRALFDEARAHQPSIIFFDEIDGLAPVRSAKQEQHHASIVSTLLALMDGMDNRGQVVVIGATNRPDSVDPALRRPGRFDREFYFPLPDFEARKKILEIHTQAWKPPLSSEFLDSISHQTKGFGGADLRAVTTEAALLAINRAYPQIYGSSAKLEVDPSSINVRPQDFTLALERIQPSTARAAGTSLAAPIPSHVEPLLRASFEKVKARVLKVFPSSQRESQNAALYLSESEFEQARQVNSFQKARIHRPRLLLEGQSGNGQNYITRAISNMLEGVYVRELNSSTLFGSGAIQPESALVSAISEVRQRAPSCLLLSSLSEWVSVPQVIGLLVGLLKSLSPEEQVFIVASDEFCGNESEFILNPLIDFFTGESVPMEIDTSKEILTEFFSPIFEFIKRNPMKCLEAQCLPKLTPPKLKVDTDTRPKELPPPVDSSETNVKPKNGSVFSDAERRELRVRSQLKLKLGIILDGFRQKYRRFRKPVIDEVKLAYLFENPVESITEKPDEPERPVTEPIITETAIITEQEPTEHEPTVINDQPDVSVELEVDEVFHPFVVSADRMILETSTDKKYFNMDLETVEDRLWNGFYCVPEQFLQDIEKIYKDSVVHGERERIHKASEMLANAQVAIDDICLDKQFIAGCEFILYKDAETRLKDLETAVSKSSEPEKQNEISNEQVQEVSHDTAVETVVSEEPIDEQVPKETGISLQEFRDGLQKDISLNQDTYNTFVQRLLECGNDLNLESLEQLYASLCDVCWSYKDEWDRTKMVEALSNHLFSVASK